MSFEEFHLHSAVLEGIVDLNYDEPTKIQSECIPIVLDGKDVVASSQTGTGKTGAFVIPILSKLAGNAQKGIRALILTPTRELAKQIDEQIVALGYHTGVTSVTVYGGGTPDDWNRQEKALYQESVNIVVATPGRLIDHMKIKPVDFSKLDYFVLDEADRMLDMGFIPDVRTIESKLPGKRQNLLFSATIPDDIERFIHKFSRNPERINIATYKVAKGVRQIAYKVPSRVKEALLIHLLGQEEYKSCIVFVGTKRGTEELARSIIKKGLKAKSMHGDRTQAEREEALRDFRSGKCNVLVATDVLSRGIDIDDVSHIINYDVPGDLDDYIHRIGRTARAESTGDAVTFVSERDRNKIRPIYHAMKDDLIILEVPEEIRPSKNEQDNKANNRQRQSSNSRHRTSSKNRNQNHNRSNNSKSSGNKQDSLEKGSSNRSQSNNKSRGKSQDVKKSNGPSHSKQSGSSNTIKENNNGKTARNKGKTDNRRKTDSPVKKNSRSYSKNSENKQTTNPRSSNKRKSNNKNKRREQQQNESMDSMRARQRKSLRDAQATKRALMANQVEPNPKTAQKGIFGAIKKLFSK